MTTLSDGCTTKLNNNGVQVKRKRMPTGRKRGGQKAVKPTESSRPSNSQGTSQPGSELTAAPGADEDEAEGGGVGMVDDADTEEEQIGATLGWLYSAHKVHRLTLSAGV